MHHPTLRTQIVWHSLSLVGIVLVASHVLLRTPFWQLPADQRAFLLGLALTYGLAALGVAWRTRRTGRVHIPDHLGWVVSAFGVYGFILLLFEAFYSRAVLLVALVLACVAAILPHTVVLSRPRLVLAAVALSVAAVAALGLDQGARRSTVTMERRYVATSLYNLRLSLFHNQIVPETNGGGLAMLGAGFLLTSGDGRIFYLERHQQDGALQVAPLPYRVPINRAQFIADMPDDILTGRFRVADVLVQERADTVRVLVSHHFWKRAERCFVLRVSMMTAERVSFIGGDAQEHWQTLYDARPCLGLIDDARESRFAGHQMGGRLVEWRPDTVILTVGDHLFDGWNSRINLPQDPHAEYGKTMLIDVEAGTARVFSMGHRNPQGLYLDTGGTLWLTEHGPQGGDELNIVVDGGNYGWPLVSYGTEYGLAEWPLSIAQGDHAGFERPVFAWNPSIGVSSIIGVERDLFPWWRGDLLVGSLRAGTLWRVRVHEERVLLVEPIVINLGIRDLVEAGDGRLWFWLDGGSIAVGEPAPAPAPSETVAGELVLGQCRGCHQIGDGTAHGIGPDLAGVVGRDVASARGFAYSAALRATSGTWSPERLHRFLADPSADVPGTAMAFPGISDSTRRAAIIAYLRDPPGRR